MIKRHDTITVKAVRDGTTITGYVTECDISGDVIVFRAYGQTHILDTCRDSLLIGDGFGSWAYHDSKFHVVSHEMTECGSWIPARVE